MLPPANTKSTTTTSTTYQPTTSSTTTSTTPKTTTSTTAPKACVVVDIDFRGNDIGYLGNIGSWEDCNCECKKKAGCTHFTWHAYSSGQCFLKNVLNPVYKKGDFSASVECFDKCSP